MTHPATRRELISLRIGDDDARLRHLLEFEYLGVDLYGRALRSRRLGVRARRTAQAILAQEQRHVVALSARVIDATPRRRSSPASGLDRALGRAGIAIDPRAIAGERGWLQLLAQFEQAVAGAYYDALGRLHAREAAGLAATILADEAQHATLLSELLHPGDLSLAVPAAAVPERALDQ